MRRSEIYSAHCINGNFGLLENYGHAAVLYLVSAMLMTCTAAATGSEDFSPPVVSVGEPAETGWASAAEFKERLILVDINRQQLNQTVLVLENQAGALYLRGDDLQHWRLRTPDANAAISYRGELYFPISAILDVSHSYDPKTLALMIEVRPEAFIQTARSSYSGNTPVPVKPEPGGFFNYDLFSAHIPGTTQTSGQFELGYFNQHGVGIGNILARKIANNTSVTRLDTTWTTDFPEEMQTLRLGDAISTPGTWGRSVRFGGIQFGTNFGTQPGFDTYPPQSAAGLAVLPSTVDVFINNALVSHQSVPPGPFSIANLPVVTGAGNIRLVVRDLFGREQVTTRPFYASQSLLRKGLEGFSGEFGFVRENFGINSNEYGEWLGSGTYRRGLSERLTGELRAEVMHDQVTIGFGGDFLMPQLGTIATYAAASHKHTGEGGLLLLGFDRLAQPWSLGARTQWMSGDFTQLGLQPPLVPAILVSSINLSYATRSSGSIGIAYVALHNRYSADSRVGTLSYSASLGKAGSLTVSALHAVAGDTSTTLFATLSIALGQAESLNGSVQSVRGGGAVNSNELTTTLQRNLPPGEGFGYQLQVRSDGDREASYSFQNNAATYVIDATQNQGAVATRLDMSGGVAMLGKEVFLSRRIDQSFAVARIPDFPGVRILADNQPSGRTDAQGNALIPQLRAYDINLISIDQRDIPLDANVGALVLQAIPYFRSGIELAFPVRHSRGATLTVRLEDGQPLPVGTQLRKVGMDDVFIAGYAGEVYVTGLESFNRLRANWNGKVCEFMVRFETSADPLPDLGIFVCKVVVP